MTHRDDDPTVALDAGELSAWLAATRRALDGEVDADVPCDGCTACCEASQFVHIGPDEAETLAHVPEALLVPAPGLPPGHVVMGYDEHGRCPMLVEGACSIYEHRPRTCRTYDCRVFAATGVVPDEPAKAGIAVRVRRWRFTPSGTGEDDAVRDAQLRDALARAAAMLAEDQGVRPEGAPPPSATGRAVLAVELHDLFLGRDPSSDEVRAALRARASGDGGAI